MTNSEWRNNRGGRLLIVLSWIGGSFIGPVLATTILSVSSPAVLYVTLGLACLVCVPLALRPWSRSDRRDL